MLGFQQYQKVFTAHIRDPKNNKKPDNVNEERIAVYRNGVYNNIFESVSVCFPVCQTTLGKKEWNNIIKRFVAMHAASSPIFRKIPEEFLKFLESDNETPEYIKQLAHYEWVELAVGSLQSQMGIDKTGANQPIDLLNQVPILAPHMLLEYDYPVHKISAQFTPKQLEQTHLLVFRNLAFEVNFVELNPMTYLLLESIKKGMAGKQALISLAERTQHSQPETIIEFGHGILKDLKQQQAIIGSHSTI